MAKVKCNLPPKVSAWLRHKYDATAVKCKLGKQSCERSVLVRNYGPDGWEWTVVGTVDGVLTKFQNESKTP